jgi:hypothetical protein
MGFSTKSKQIAFHKLGHIHYAFKILFLPFQPNHLVRKRGYVKYPPLVAASSWSTS